MKDLFKNFAVFIALVFAISSLSGCPSASTEKGSVDEAKTDANTTEVKKTEKGSVNKAKTDANTTEAKKKDDGYPPAPAAIAQTEIKMLNGQTFKLEDQKGKVILFNLWGIWCGPCIAEMPHLVEMQEKYKDKNFEIIGLNVGDDSGNPESEQAINDFAARQKLNYPLGYADRKLFDEFARTTKLAGVPQSVLISREGKIIGIFTGGGPRVINSMKETVEKTLSDNG